MVGPPGYDAAIWMRRDGCRWQLKLTHRDEVPSKPGGFGPISAPGVPGALATSAQGMLQAPV
jgi:hypothetical protein